MLSFKEIYHHKIVRIVLITVAAFVALQVFMFFRYETSWRRVFPNKAMRVVRSEQHQLGLPSGGEQFNQVGCYEDEADHLRCDNYVSVTYPDKSQLEAVLRQFKAHGWRQLEISNDEANSRITASTTYSYDKEVDRQALCARVSFGGKTYGAEQPDALWVSVSGPGDESCGYVVY